MLDWESELLPLLVIVRSCWLNFHTQEIPCLRISWLQLYPQSLQNSCPGSGKAKASESTIPLLPAGINPVLKGNFVL
jgi:hypothetical protein